MDTCYIKIIMMPLKTCVLKLRKQPVHSVYLFMLSYAPCLDGVCVGGCLISCHFILNFIEVSALAKVAHITLNVRILQSLEVK